MVSSPCKFSIIGLISGLTFSLFSQFFLSYFSLKLLIFSWVVEFLENILAFSLKQDLVYSHQSLAEERLLDHRSWSEGSYKIGSVCPSFCPSIHLHVRFFGIGSLVFSETYHNVRGPYIVVGDNRIFWKNRHRTKMVKNGPKTWFLDFWKKIASLALSGIFVNQSSYGLLTSCENCMLEKNLVLKLKTKIALGQWDFGIL